MDPRTAAHVLTRIARPARAARREPVQVARVPERRARRGRRSTSTTSAPLLRDGALEDVPGLGPATLSVVRDLVETGRLVAAGAAAGGDARRADRDAARPGPRHREDPRDPRRPRHRDRAGARGRPRATAALATLPRFGAKTAEKILKGIAFLQETGALRALPARRGRGARACSRAVRRIPTSSTAERRRLASAADREVICDIDIVAACAARRRRSPRRSGTRRACATSSARAGARCACGTSTARSSTSTACAASSSPSRSGARPAATAHVARGDAAARRARAHASTATSCATRPGAPCRSPTRRALYALAGLAFVVARAARGARRGRRRRARPRCRRSSSPADIRGVLHCHSHLLRRRGDDRRDGRRGARARLDVPRHHRPLAERVLRGRALARRRAPPARRDRRAERARDATARLPRAQGHRGRHPRRRRAGLRRRDARPLRLRDRLGALALRHGPSGR